MCETNKARIQIETLVIPTYPEPAKEEMPIFSEHRVHQRSSGGWGVVVEVSLMTFSGIPVMSEYSARVNP